MPLRALASQVRRAVAVPGADGSAGAAFAEGVACDVLPQPELAGAHRRSRGRRVHGARHGDEEKIAALGTWMRERPGPCVRSEREVRDGHVRCPRERRCMARDAVLVSLAVALRAPHLHDGAARPCGRSRGEGGAESEQRRRRHGRAAGPGHCCLACSLPSESWTPSATATISTTYGAPTFTSSSRPFAALLNMSLAPHSRPVSAGSKGPIRAHSASLSSCRCIPQRSHRMSYRANFWSPNLGTGPRSMEDRQKAPTPSLHSCVDGTRQCPTGTQSSRTPLK